MLTKEDIEDFKDDEEHEYQPEIVAFPGQVSLTDPNDTFDWLDMIMSWEFDNDE